MKTEDLDHALAFYERFTAAGGMTSQELAAVRRAIVHVRDALAKCDSDDKDVVVRRMASFTKKNGTTYDKKRCEERYEKVLQLLDRCSFLQRQTAMPWSVDGSKLA